MICLCENTNKSATSGPTHDPNFFRFFHRGCEFMCLPPEMCKFYPYFLYGNVGVSMYIMAFIALQRVFGMFYPGSAKMFNKVDILKSDVQTNEDLQIKMAILNIKMAIMNY